MNVTISARHCDLDDSLKQRVEERARRLSRYNPGVTGADVTFEMNGGAHEVEALLSLAGSGTVVARASGADFRMAFDRAADRLARQLKRKRERRVARRHTPAPRPDQTSSA